MTSWQQDGSAAIADILASVLYSVENFVDVSNGCAEIFFLFLSFESFSGRQHKNLGNWFISVTTILKVCHQTETNKPFSFVLLFGLWFDWRVPLHPVLWLATAPLIFQRPCEETESVVDETGFRSPQVLVWSSSQYYQNPDFKFQTSNG